MSRLSPSNGSDLSGRPGLSLGHNELGSGLGDRRGPRIPEIGVLALTPDRWSDLWGTRHHVLVRLARYFHVVWVNPAREWRDVAYLRPAPSRPPRYPFGQNGFCVYEPEAWLPIFYRPPWLAEFTLRQRVRRATALLRRAGCRKLVAFLWKPDFADVLDAVHFDSRCYYITDEYSYMPVERPISEQELRLLNAVDQVFIHSPALLEKKGKINPHTAFVPNGVDYSAFALAGPEPADLAAIPRPRIGYAGVVKEQLDWNLLASLVDRHPAFSFVFVGPIRPAPGLEAQIEPLQRRANVYFLGPKSRQAVATYPKHFDVCIMPYRVDDYTKYIYPLKLHESLASGRPTIGTPIRTLQDFSEVVTLASGVDQWSAALMEALSQDASSPERCVARQQVARQHDWEPLTFLIAKTMAERLGRHLADSPGSPIAAPEGSGIRSGSNRLYL